MLEVGQLLEQMNASLHSTELGISLIKNNKSYLTKHSLMSIVYMSPILMSNVTKTSSDEMNPSLCVLFAFTYLLVTFGNMYIYIISYCVLCQAQ